ncbi:tRNA(NNU) t(6)A37 threonylcarbamoyladenosine modification; threonine-dependent ADP-forming ATPase [[Clostridium] ultunense Esp]|nr:tRNA(NNU) t(6)A37 threonylcarbamoyladenosine modification; threonine-dependent ADP-forming ATPase [[Clostridium] ultunense Esp]
METKQWLLPPDEVRPSHPFLIEAAKLLRQGEVVAFPTETVYGLGADAYSDQAVAKIYAAKGRPSDNPLILHFYDPGQVKEVVTHLPPLAEELFRRFSPGPLTLILPNNGRASSLATAGLSTVAVRVPNHPVALALLREVGRPLAAPSANRSGKPSPTKAAHVLADLEGRIAGIIDGGETGIGLESTVLDITLSPPQILRPGGITKESLEEVIGKVGVDPALNQSNAPPKAPGLKYPHYAPRAPLTLVADLNPSRRRRKMAAQAAERIRDGKRVGILTTDEDVPYFEEHLPGEPGNHWVILSLGERGNLDGIAQHLYEALRSFDPLDVDEIIGESFPKGGIGAAIMNRLSKAAGRILP